VQVLDRHGVPLTVTYQNRWNIHDNIPLYRVPVLLQQAFIQAEDRRFYQHGGVDWLARLHALGQNLLAGKPARGASTITEQVVRMWHPRPRTLWSRWLEGLEAAGLESHFSKATILELYLNQVPYAGQRRGVVQAARDYFDRDLNTLSTQEILALAVLIRAPSRLDLHQGTAQVEGAIAQLASHMRALNLLTEDQYRSAVEDRLVLRPAAAPVQATHFVEHLYERGAPARTNAGRLHTTLDSTLQHTIQDLLDQRLSDLHASHVENGAVLVVDHRSNQILAWVNGGDLAAGWPGSRIDAVTTPRQPSSALKPFLYALALEKGWTAATLIDDTPLALPVGTGLHPYRNYSRLYYGPVRLRIALGNSLNIPAVRTVQFVGPARFLERLSRLGFQSLDQHPDYYGDGLALGNGEATLFELVQAYATLARQGVFSPLKATRYDTLPEPPSRWVFSEQVSSLIAHILSDPEARRLEFGNGNLLRFPVQTAVKTGTSSGHRDAWAIGFSRRYTAGVWMGNLDRRPMRHVSGATGPALVLRAVFAELNRYEQARPLYLSPRLTAVRICPVSGQRAGPHCPTLTEWFEPTTVPDRDCGLHSAGDGPEPVPVRSASAQKPPLRLLQPTPGLLLAMDPRIPDRLEAFPFRLPKEVSTLRIDWVVDGSLAATTSNGQNEYLWPLVPGRHIAQARIWLPGHAEPVETPAVGFRVNPYPCTY
jgi:penicillin-binding protein 1C